MECVKLLACIDILNTKYKEQHSNHQLYIYNSIEIRAHFIIYQGTANTTLTITTKPTSTFGLYNINEYVSTPINVDQGETTKKEPERQTIYLTLLKHKIIDPQHYMKLNIRKQATLN